MFQQNQTPSLNFTLLNIPVRIEPFFFLIAAVLSSMYLGTNNFALCIMGMIVIFISILLHELGHAFAGHNFGLKSSITIHGMGGYCAWQNYARLTYGQDMMISFAGPFAGLILGGTSYLIYTLIEPGSVSPMISTIIIFTAILNISWSILNLIPLLPLDGGHIMEKLYLKFSKRPDHSIPIRFSIALGFILVILAVMGGQGFMALLFGYMTYTNYESLKKGPSPW